MERVQDGPGHLVPTRRLSGLLSASALHLNAGLPNDEDLGRGNAYS